MGSEMCIRDRDTTEAAQYLNARSKAALGESWNFDNSRVSALAREKVLSSEQKSPGSPHFFDIRTLDSYLAKRKASPALASSFFGTKNIGLALLAGAVFSIGNWLISSGNKQLILDPERSLSDIEEVSLTKFLQYQTPETNIGQALQAMVVQKEGPFEVKELSLIHI